jgi:hypothetical protein
MSVAAAVLLRLVISLKSISKMHERMSESVKE